MMEDFVTSAVHQSQHYKEAIKHIKDRKDGLITSFKTPWDKLNDQTLDGFEWRTMVTLAARSSVGKTAIKDQIIRLAHNLNPNTQFEIVEFQFELPPTSHVIRQLAGYTGMPYEKILSKQRMADDDFEKIKRNAKNIVTNLQLPYVVSRPLNVEGLRKEIEYHSGVLFAGKKVVYTLDHAGLVLRTSKADERTTLIELAAMITEMKNKYDLIFILLTQMNRNIEKPERNTDGSAGNFITSSDIMGSDAVMQHSDILIGINRPGMFNIRYYGPMRYQIHTRYDTVFHMIKNRNGEAGQLLWFKFNGSTMSLEEMDTPASKETLF